jgi:tetratricopeptide (TPR) repeat protein
VRALALLISCLAAFASPLSAQVLVAEAQPPAPAETHWQALGKGLNRLDQSLIQQLDGALWADVRDSAHLGLADITRAHDLGAALDVCQATRTTLRAVLARQDLLEREAFAEDTSRANIPDDETQRLAWLDSEYNAVYDSYGALADDLLFQEGRLVQTSWLLVELLFTVQRDAEAADVLSRALAMWPSSAILHDQTKAWSDVLPAPADLAAQLQARVDLLDLADADYAGIALETIALLQTAIGRTAYNERNFALSGIAFDRAATSLQRSVSMPRQWGSDEISFRRADSLVSAAYSFLGLALDLWSKDRSDEQALLAAAACEEQIAKALQAVPGHPAASQAVLWLGDHLMNKGDPSRSTLVDQGQARDLYGRMAKRFEIAEWWNNYGFWCRETGTATEALGNATDAEALYENSYGAYVQSIKLSPDNSRYTNDTGLMLFYHLNRDLDEAQSLFQRSWELGAAVCSNPFVEESVFDENFSAYTDAILNLARLHLQRGDLEQAQTAINTLIELAPERGDGQLTRRDIAQALATRG